ncbi:MAG: TonB-dependent receptor [Cyclobacteriaceae bacterium]
MTKIDKLFKLLLMLLFVTSVALAQDVNVTGKVTDENGEGLPGASVVVKGTTNGATSDLNGDYNLSAPKDATLVISFVGYIKQEVELAGRNKVDINMEVDAGQLEEVIVIGYGQEKKSNMTGSVSSIDSEKLTAVPVANTTNLLSGRVPGVMVRQNSGLPGGENTQIRIRGFAGSPLILVDGVQMGMDRIDPNDIESINVLKDAAAAVYGARAGNGVVLVTTKRGKEGPPSISYSGSYTAQSAVEFMEHASASQYAQLVREANLMDGVGIDATFTEEDVQNYAIGAPGFEGGNWIDALIKNNAPMQQHSLSVTGGSEDVKYFTSIGYTSQESYFRSRDYDYKRFNARSNVDAKINDYLSFNLDLSFRRDERSRPQESIDALWTDLATSQPTLPTQLPDPSVGVAFSGFSQRTPLGLTDKDLVGTWDRNDHTFRGKLGLKLDVPHVDGLQVRAEMNIEHVDRAVKTFRNFFDIYQYQPETDTYLFIASNGNGNTNISESQWRRIQVYPTFAIEYEKSIGDHNFKLLGVAEQQTRKINSFSASRRNLLTTSIREIFIGSTDEQFSNGSSSADIGRKSYVGRFNYRYKNRYLLEATFRADGNVLFAPQTRWGYFPSISAGWVMSDEAFLESSSFLDNLKVRASYSKLGDDTAGGLSGFDYLTGYGLQGIYLYGDNVAQPAIRTFGLVNPALTWETMTMYNFGVEASFLEGRLSFEADLFYRKREGIIAPNIEAVPAETGANLPVVNIDSQDNKGIELSLNYQQRVGDFKFDISPNLTIARAKWLDVKSQEAFDDPDQERINGRDGQLLNRTIGYVTDGLFMSQEEIDTHDVIQGAGNDNASLRPGDIRYVDLDGNDTINFRDQRVIGRAQVVPDLIYAMNLGVSYKNFSLNVLLQGASNFAINIGGSARTMFSNASIPLTYHYDYRWQPDPNDPTVNINPDAKLPAPSLSQSSNNNRTSDFWLKDVTYLRVKTINLAYDIPNQVLSKIGMKNAQIYLAAENLLTLTNLGIYKNSFDPEFEPGNPNRRYPITKQTTIGFRVSF